MTSPVVFFVDDRVDVTRAFKLEAPESWQVHTFTFAVDALKAIDKLRPTLLITDVEMPGLHGIDFFTIATKIMKNIGVIVISAYEEPYIVKNFGSLEGVVFFRKPIEAPFWNAAEDILAKSARLSAESSADVSGVDRIDEKMATLHRLTDLVVSYDMFVYQAMLENGRMSSMHWYNSDYEKLGEMNIELNSVQKFLGMTDEHFDEIFNKIRNEKQTDPILNINLNQDSIICEALQSVEGDGDTLVRQWRERGVVALKCKSKAINYSMLSNLVKPAKSKDLEAVDVVTIEKDKALKASFDNNVLLEVAGDASDSDRAAWTLAMLKVIRRYTNVVAETIHRIA